MDQSLLEQSQRPSAATSQIGSAHIDASKSADTKMDMKAAIACLHPVKPSLQAVKGSGAQGGGTRSRFSQLLLEHGERHLQDWAVVASSSLCSMPQMTLSRQSTGGAGAGSTQVGNVGGNARIMAIERTLSSDSQQQQQQQLQSAMGAAVSSPSTCMGHIEGRLRLCSHSVVFEPTDWSRGIIRCPFVRMDGPPISLAKASSNFHASPVKEEVSESLYGDDAGSSGAVAVLKCNRHLVMKTMNVIGPFENIEVPTMFRFTFVHSSPVDFLEMAQSLFRSMKNERGAKSLEDMLKPIIDRPFDASNFSDVRERPLTSNLRCSILSPLLSSPGCAIATKSRLYFQPSVGCVTGAVSSRATSWPFEEVICHARRYSGLRDSGMELFLKGGTSVLIAFETRRDREQVMRLLPQEVPCHTDREFVIRAIMEWQSGSISNFEYLLALNSAAGRTFHDLSRYPVYPWVISDYKSSKLDLKSPQTFRDLSKPVGALDESRLEYFRTRFSGMQDMEHPFLYGTHYSAPGYVLYYLVRSMPEHMLCLQNGKFDSPDRMFHSLEHCYSSVLTNHADVKELIPEFYDPNAGFDFLINARNLKLGVTQNGDRVDDVKLPPWARSARDFIKKNRKALESKLCTEELPKWINLIFGVDSRRENAKRASNLFHQMAYLGPADLDAMSTDEEKARAELQATEFGIVPDQLFALSHPSKNETVNLDDVVCPDSGRGNVYWANDENNEKCAETNVEKKLGLPGGDQPWELLDSPSRSMKSFDDEESEPNRSRGWSADSFRDRLWSTESANDKGDTSSKGNVTGNVTVTKSPNQRIGFGGSMLSSPFAEKPLMAEWKNEDRKDAMSPRGKAKSSWLPTSSVNNGNGADATYNHKWKSGNSAAHAETSSSLLDFGEIGSQRFEASQDLTSEINGGNLVSHTSMSKVQSLTTAGDRGGRALLSSRDQRATLIKTGSNGSPPDNDLTSGVTQQGWTLKSIASRRAHGDVVSACALLVEGNGEEHSCSVVTVSLDCCLAVQTIEEHGGVSRYGYRVASGSRSSALRMLSRSVGRGNSSSVTKLNSFRHHSTSDPLACLSLAEDKQGGQIVFAGGHDDVVLAYGINSACALASVYSHRDAVTGIDLIPRSGSPNSATHVMVSGSWDATVKVWSVTVAAGETVSINREPLAELFDADASVVSVAVTEVMGVGFAICAGCSDGSFVVWLCGSHEATEVIHKEEAKRGNGQCSTVKWGAVMTQNTEKGSFMFTRGSVFFAGFATGKIGSFILKNKSVSPLSEISLGSPVRCLAVESGLLIAGCADGGLRAVPIERDAFFDSSLRIWSAVNGTDSPSISCVTLKTVRCTTNNERRLCATGADDGTVALFELTQS